MHLCPPGSGENQLGHDRGRRDPQLPSPQQGTLGWTECQTGSWVWNSPLGWCAWTRRCGMVQSTFQQRSWTSLRPTRCDEWQVRRNYGQIRINKSMVRVIPTYLRSAANPAPTPLFLVGVLTLTKIRSASLIPLSTSVEKKRLRPRASRTRSEE